MNYQILLFLYFFLAAESQAFSLNTRQNDIFYLNAQKTYVPFNMDEICHPYAQKDSQSTPYNDSNRDFVSPYGIPYIKTALVAGLCVVLWGIKKIIFSKPFCSKKKDDFKKNNTKNYDLKDNELRKKENKPYVLDSLTKKNPSSNSMDNIKNEGLKNNPYFYINLDNVDAYDKVNTSSSCSDGPYTFCHNQEAVDSVGIKSFNASNFNGTYDFIKKRHIISDFHEKSTSKKLRKIADVSLKNHNFDGIHTDLGPSKSRSEKRPSVYNLSSVASDDYVDNGRKHTDALSQDPFEESKTQSIKLEKQDERAEFKLSSAHKSMSEASQQVLHQSRGVITSYPFSHENHLENNREVGRDDDDDLGNGDYVEEHSRDYFMFNPGWRSNIVNTINYPPLDSISGQESRTYFIDHSRGANTQNEACVYVDIDLRNQKNTYFKLRPDEMSVIRKITKKATEFLENHNFKNLLKKNNTCMQTLVKCINKKNKEYNRWINPNIIPGLIGIINLSNKNEIIFDLPRIKFFWKEKYGDIIKNKNMEKIYNQYKLWVKKINGAKILDLVDFLHDIKKMQGSNFFPVHKIDPHFFHAINHISDHSETIKSFVFENFHEEATFFNDHAVALSKEIIFPSLHAFWVHFFPLYCQLKKVFSQDKSFRPDSPLFIRSLEIFK